MNSTLVSVVIPTYNCARYVCESIESALNQTYENIEVILVDDGSTDDTQDRIKPYRNRIKYVYQKNSGVSVARNTGISKATGEWIAFLDSDDLWHPQKTEVQLASISQKKDAAVIGTRYIGSMPQKLSPDAPIRQLSVRDFLISAPIAVSSTMVKRFCFDEVGGFDETVITSVEDRDMWLRLVSRYATYQVLSPCWWYRQHEGQMSRKAQHMFKYYHQILDKFFLEHPEHLSFRRLAYGYLHVDAANCFYDEGSRLKALFHLLKSWAWYLPNFDGRRRFWREILFLKFALGEDCFRRLRRIAGRSDEAEELLDCRNEK